MAYVDSTNATGNGSTPSVAVPAGVAAGDIVILACAIDVQAAVFDTGDWPSGFTELAETDITADGHTAAVGWKRLTGADGGTYDFGNLGASGDWVCQAFAFSGRHASNPPVISTTNVQNTAQSSPVTVSANGVTAVDGDDLLWISAPDVTSSGAGNGHTAPASYTEREDAENLWANLSGATRENVSAGATGTVSGTFALSQDTAGWAAWLIRIPLADAGPPGGFRLLENGTDRRVLEDGVTFRILEETEEDETLFFTGTITPAGSLLKTVTKPHTGSITPAGALLKTITKPFTGTITPSGLFTALRTILFSFTATITPTGALTMIKAVLRSFTATISPAGSLAKTVAKGFVATITPAGAFAKAASFLRAFTASITPAGSLLNRITKPFAGFITPTGSFAFFKVIVRAFTATITPTGSFSKINIKSFVGSISPVGSLVRVATFVRTHTATITPEGALFKTIFKSFFGVIDLVGSFIGGLFGVADKVQVVVSDRLRTQLTASDRARTELGMSDQTRTHLAVSDGSKAQLGVSDRTRTSAEVSDELGN
jgi:hypothetical protein